MRSSTQKKQAHPNTTGLIASLSRLAGFVVLGVSVGIVAYLISQRYDGILTAALASALTTLAITIRAR